MSLQEYGEVFIRLFALFTFVVIGGFVVSQVWIILSDLSAFPDSAKTVANVLQTVIGIVPADPLAIGLLFVVLPSVFGTVLVAWAS